MTVDTQYPNPKHVKVPAAVNSTLARTRRPLTHQLRMGGGTGRGWAMRAILLILIPNLIFKLKLTVFLVTDIDTIVTVIRQINGAIREVGSSGEGS